MHILDLVHSSGANTFMCEIAMCVCVCVWSVVILWKCYCRYLLVATHTCTLASCICYVHTWSWPCLATSPEYTYSIVLFSTSQSATVIGWEVPLCLLYHMHLLVCPLFVIICRHTECVVNIEMCFPLLALWSFHVYIVGLFFVRGGTSAYPPIKTS